MSANYITDIDEFAETIVGVPADEFRSWIFDSVDPDSLPVKPVLLCAEALGTNAEYLLCISDDPRPGEMLNYDESVILFAFRAITDSAVRARLLQEVEGLAARFSSSPSPNQPFPRAPIRRRPPANES
mgnify:FL=1